MQEEVNTNLPPSINMVRSHHRGHNKSSSNYNMPTMTTQETSKYLITLPSQKSVNEKQISNPFKSFENTEYQTLPVTNNKSKANTLSTSQSTTMNNPDSIVEYYKNPFDYSTIAENTISGNALINRRSLRKASKMKIWNCMLCSEKRTSKEDLLDHYENHKKITDELKDDEAEDNTEYSFTCPACKFTFDDTEKFKRHVILKHGPKEYYCDICKYGLANYVFLTVHNAIQHNEDHDTMICAACKQFSTTSNDELIAHIELEHITDTFFCDECKDTFISKEWYENHKIFHVKSQVTLYGEDNNSYLRNSLAVKSHIQKVFNSNQTSSDEKTTEIKYKKYQCVDCNLTFPYNKNLEKHLRLIHSINKESFLCSICGKTFDKQNALSTHSKTHKTKDHVCSICGKRFSRWQGLKIHIRTHTGEKPHKCPYCDKSFAQKSPLNLHLRTHTGERPYPCENCNKGFISKAIRDAHQRRCNK